MRLTRIITGDLDIPSDYARNQGFRGLPKSVECAGFKWQHISDEDLERYHLGMVKDEAELAALEEHLLACPECVTRAEQASDYADAMRAAIIEGDFDLKLE